MLEDENKTAETTVDTEVDSHADIDKETNPSENVNDVEFTDSSDGQAQPKQEPQKPANEQNNSENARRRREAERQAELERVTKEAREKAIIEALGGKNPYTNEEMKDSADVEEFLTMKEIEKNGGDPLSDFSKHQKAKEREKAAKQAEIEAKKDWYRKDREDFASKHPEVNLENLIQDKQFQLFASGKVGNLPLSEIYEGFMEVTSEYEKKAKQKAKQLLANSKSTPGALSSPNTPDNGFFTKEQVQKMSQEEVDRNYDKIRASMRKWK